MMRLRYIVGVLFTALMITYTQAAKSESVFASMSDPAEVITVKADSPEFTINLQANPSTGYTWLLQPYDKKVITFKNYDYRSSNPAMVGASGVASWKFKLNLAAFMAPSTYTLTFEYKRPWEPQPGKKVTFTIITKP